MVFSSNLFLYVFLTPFLAVYYALHFTSRQNALASNALLLAVSVALYFWSNGSALMALVATTLLTYAIAVSVERGPRAQRLPLLVLGILFNLAVLFYFKYFTFFVTNFAPTRLANYLTHLNGTPAALPVGISFYTFMAISFLAEVHKGLIKPASLLNFSTYLTMFPHLVAGPIVRYSEIEKSVQSRRIDLDGMFEGLWRFAIGLSKKIILANPLGEAADRIFGLPIDQLSPELAWVGALAYTFQIFFDFSGYTDMAIGLALMLGFRFPENFNNPYRASSITEFWRRWHMTLTRWFRDYLYIPLGGNRKGLARTLFNLFLVFLLCGLWHGAAWTFIIWGAYHGILLVSDRLLAERLGIKFSGPLGTALTFFLVIIGWIMFRSETVHAAFGYLKTMGFFHAGTPPQAFAFYSPASTIFYIGLAAIVTFAPLERVFAGTGSLPQTVLRGAVVVILVAASLISVSITTYTPFIYFRF